MSEESKSIKYHWLVLKTEKNEYKEIHNMRIYRLNQTDQPVSESDIFYHCKWLTSRALKKLVQEKRLFQRGTNRRKGNYEYYFIIESDGISFDDIPIEVPDDIEADDSEVDEIDICRL